MAVHFVPPSPDTGLIDWGLRANDLGKILIPFARYVKPNPLHRAHGNFPAFTQLPAELQFHILRFCDSPNLFQLMQTSAALCREAKKLFWSDSDAWYRIDANWLLRGGFSGDAHFATDFIRQVQQIEVSFEDMEAFLQLDSSEVEERQVEDRTRRICWFWCILQKTFPKVVRVVMSDETARAAESISLSNIQRTAEDGLSVIDLYASVATLDDLNLNLATKSRIRLNTVDGHQDVTESPWARQTIIILPKVWRGPTGEYAEALYHDKQHLKRGVFGMCWLFKQLREIALVSRARYFPVHNVIPCADSNLRMEENGQYMLQKLSIVWMQKCLRCTKTRLLDNRNVTLSRHWLKDTKG